MKWLDKDDWEMRLVQYPVLYSMIRVLLFDYWFRLAFVGLLMVLAAMVLSLAHIWVVSPPGLEPKVRISGLNWMQAKVLQKAALKASQENRENDAAYAWKAATARNPGDVDIVRGALRFFASTNRASSYSDTALRHSYWLLKISNTNSDDLVLVCGFLELAGLHDHIIELLTPSQNQLSPTLEKFFSRALFEKELYYAFANRWERMEDEVKKDPLIDLYHTAYLAGWGPRNLRADNLRLLRSKIDVPALSIAVNRLLLKVSRAQSDPDAYRDALMRLDSVRANGLIDHVNYWELLASCGRKSNAVELATSQVVTPKSALETSRLAEVYAELGLKDRALDVLQRYVPEYDNSITGWLAYGKFLREEGRWQNLRDVALHLRHKSALRDDMAGYSYLLEGLAEQGLGKNDLSDKAFKKATELEYSNLMLGITASSELMRVGQLQYASEILNKLEPRCGRNGLYWEVASQCAFELKQGNRLVDACARAYELRSNLANLNRYAAALLIQRQNPTEAIKLTVQLISVANTPAAKLNHCQALLQNQRIDEAGSILAGLDARNYNAEENNTYYMAQFEYCYLKKDYARAKEHLSKIDRKMLFSSELVWIQDLEKNLP
jgi:hypothetical protein